MPAPARPPVTARTTIGRLVYERLAPRLELRGLVEGYWVMRAPTCRTALELALPDPAVDIYVNLGPNPRALIDPATGRRRLHRRAWVVGPHAAALRLAKEVADCDIVGARLAPGAAAALLGVPARELCDTVVDLEDLWGSVEHLRERLFEEHDGSRRALLLEETLAARLAASGMADALRGIRAARAIARQPRTTIAALAARIGLSHRGLIALFDRHVGLKPKLFQRVRRLRAAIDTEERAAPGGWAAVAQAARYYDQADLINEFRRLAGMTPGTYARARGLVPGFVPWSA